MSRVHVADRKPSKLATEENALELARQIRELDYIRNFGFKVRMAKTPRNWDEWSTDAKAAWVLREADKLDRLRRLDETYLAQKRREVERDVKKLLHNITAGNSYKRPKYIEEANRRLMCQDAAIEACNELYTDLQDIMDTLPIDKNWMVQIEPLIDRELALLHGWRNGDAATHTIAQGQYVIWHSALYTADAAITSGTTLAASGNDKNLTAVENGGLNALNSNFTPSVFSLDYTDTFKAFIGTTRDLYYIKSGKVCIVSGYFYIEENQIPSNKNIQIANTGLSVFRETFFTLNDDEGAIVRSKITTGGSLISEGLFRHKGWHSFSATFLLN